MISNIHCEAQEEDIIDKFSEYGDVRNIELTLDKCTGYVKGYALIQYEKLEQAKEAISEMNQSQLLGQIISVGFAFKQK
jgi:RNA recognition motif-containing protein